MTLKVTLDPGHGGSDSGAVGARAKEKDVNLAISKLAAKYLAASGIEVQMTRQDDSFVSLSDRATMANNNNSDYFISVHANAGGGKGTEVFAYSSTGKGAALAAKILTEIVTDLGLTNRGVKTANFAVLRLTSMPAVLVETAFLDNSQEEALLIDLVKQDVFAKAISDGFRQYAGVPAPPPVVPPPIALPPAASNPYLDMNLKSISGLAGEDIKNFIRSVHSDSPLASYGDKFVLAERNHGTNALFLMALAIHEAGWSASGDHASLENNIFGYHLGKPDGKFANWEECIDKVSAEITRNYLSSGGAFYRTPTLKGMAENYSEDPEWASGIAGIMQRMRPTYIDPRPWLAAVEPDPALVDAFLQSLAALIKDMVRKQAGS